MIRPDPSVLESLIHEDVGQRGLEPLFEATRDELGRTAAALSNLTTSRVLIVTGFCIPEVWRAETDGPLGAWVLAEAIAARGGKVGIGCDPWLYAAMTHVRNELSAPVSFESLCANQQAPLLHGLPVTHLLAIERPGPSWADGRLRSMSGIDVTDHHLPVHGWFENQSRNYKTLAIGDGGNEIGMGNLPRHIVAERIPFAAAIHCRTPADHLITAGVSNWGAYALAILLLGPHPAADTILDDARHTRIARRLVEEAGLVNGFTGRAELAVDGLPWTAYIRRFRELAASLCVGED